MNARSKKRNPVESAERAYRVFHGHEPEEQFLIKEDTHWHSVLAGCGRLEELIVDAPEAGEVTLSGFGKDCLLAMNEKRTQLYVKGGDQSVDLRDFGIDPGSAHDLEVLGELVFAGYHTRKDHLDEEDGGQATYEHDFGGEDEDGNQMACPTLLYDKLNERLLIAGGDYRIDAEGIIY